jgi:serine/threonine-protein kinase
MNDPTGTSPDPSNTDQILLDLPSLLQFQPQALKGRQLGRYKLETWLGRGAIGVVYKSYDSILKRHVALKLLYADETKNSEHILQEAQAQARVEHPNICKVFDVGQVGKTYYIAMQCLEGDTLDVATHDLNLSQKVEVMRRVAQAIHAAHQKGLVHRDLKPSNIIIKKEDRGKEGIKLHPFVLDFGLAREIKADPNISERQVAGSPAYMSPEQVRCEPQQFEGQTDVYGLGATTYFLLCGKAPFTGNNNVQVLMNVVREPTPKLREANARIPRDLEAIVARAMDKEPDRRYANASTYAKDLARFINHEPVSARAPVLSYIFWKKLQKNPVLSAVGGLVAVALLLLVSFIVVSQFRQERETNLIRRFSSEVEGVDWYLRVSQMMPPHNVRPYQSKINQRIESLKQDMAELGTMAEGPGHFAIGRAYLALGQHSEAREHLEMAIAAGYDDAVVYESLGLALGSLYEVALRNANAILNPKLRTARREEIKKNYRDPSLEALRKAKGSWLGISSFLEARIAWYESRLEDALALLDKMPEDTNWFFEARLLKGQIYVQQSLDAESRGDYEESRKYLELARTDFQQVQEIAPSFLPGYVHELERLTWVFTLNVREGIDNVEVLSQMDQAFETALLVYPDHPAVIAERARFLSEFGEYLFYFKGESPEATVERGISLLDTTSMEDASRENRERMLFSRASLLNLKCEYVMSMGEDPGIYFEEAARVWNFLLELRPNDTYYLNSAGVLHWTKAEHDSSRGRNPTEAIAKARKYLETISLSDPELDMAQNNLGLVFWTLGAYEWYAGENPVPSFEQSANYFQRAIDLNKTLYAYSNKAGVLLNIATYRVLNKKDPNPVLEDVLNLIEKVTQISPELPDIYDMRGRVNRTRAWWAMLTGENPEPFFQKADQDFEELERLKGNWYGVFAIRLRQATLMAEHAINQGEINQAREALREGREYAEKGSALNEEAGDLLAEVGRLLWYEAQIAETPEIRRSTMREAIAKMEFALNRRPVLRSVYGAEEDRMRRTLQEEGDLEPAEL